MSDQRYDDYYRGGAASTYAPPPTGAPSTVYAETRRYSPSPRTEYSARPNDYNQMAPYSDEAARYNDARYYDERERERTEYDYGRRGSRGPPRTEYDSRYDDRYDDDRYSRTTYEDESRAPRRAARSRSRPRSSSRSRGFFDKERDKWQQKDEKEKRDDIIAAVVGAGAGGFLGRKFAGGKMGTVGGAVLGGIVAEEIERHREKKKAEKKGEEMKYGGGSSGRRDVVPYGGGDYDDRDYDRPSNDRRSRSRSIVDRVKRSLSRSRSRGPRNDFYDD